MEIKYNLDVNKYLKNRLQYHAASRLGISINESLAQAKNIDGHTVTDTQVWTAKNQEFPKNTGDFKTKSDIVGTTNNLVEVFMDGAEIVEGLPSNLQGKVYKNSVYPAVQLVKQAQMTSVADSDDQSWEVLSGTSRLVDWVSPVSVKDNGIPVPGFAGIIEASSGSSDWKIIQQSESLSTGWQLSKGTWQFVYMPGMLTFHPDYIPSKMGYNKLRITAFIYVGEKLSENLSLKQNAIVSLSSNVSAAFGAGSKVVVSKEDGITSSEVTIGGATLGTDASSSVLATEAAVRNAVDTKSISVEGVNAVGVSGTSTEKSIYLKIDPKDKFLNQSSDGLSAYVSLVKATDIKADSSISAHIASQYYLTDKNGNQIGDRINIPKDQFLSGAVYDDVSHELTLVMYLSGNPSSYTSTKINLSGLVDIYDGASGITSIKTTSGITFTGVVDELSEEYLTVGSSGFKLSGISGALSTKVDNSQLTAYMTKQNPIFTGILSSQNGNIIVGENNVNNGNNTIFGKTNQVSGNYNFVYGEDNKLNNNTQASHAQGKGNSITVKFAHAEGEGNTVNGQWSHAEGKNNIVKGQYAVVGGLNSISNSTGSIAFGNSVSATGSYSIAFGNNTLTQGDYSIAQGTGTKTSNKNQHVFGKYNADVNNASIIVGNGTSDSNRKNAFVVDWDGNISGTGILTINDINALQLTEEILEQLSSITGEVDVKMPSGSYLSSVQPSGFGMFTIDRISANEFIYAKDNIYTSSISASNNLINGTQCIAVYNSHAEGNKTSALFNYSHTQGIGTIANYEYQHIAGKYNSPIDAAYIIGNGTDYNNRHNAFIVDWNGTVTAGKFISTNAPTQITTISNNTITLDYTTNDKFIISIPNTQTNDVILSTANLVIGNSIVAKIKLLTNINIKFNNTNIITTSGSYYLTFANMGDGIDVVGDPAAVIAHKD